MQPSPLTDRKALAERLRAIGISAPYASQLANGRRSPSRTKALEIEKELGLPVASWPLPELDAA